ncbi:unnamed protein product [Penicillium salamii]|uniref:WD40 repeat-like protein n=1 Tax=Penicillium salamii TaxID=1612424 RepID=A0A9W4J9R7_9EURO|nr:unnamed protein product [Penicillium salamii]CAG7984932.1 unnamed protein product [Penicillium salamii]CAG8030014.1 unnamed protein product [Penicillium salamii]CAG8078385.1 unnamed protein product [Penicillium salamii]CAG8286446.1 unnamed protein product [Penicillium salamii]
MHTLNPVASSTLSLPTDNYIYTLTPSAPGTFAAISSDDSLRLFDAGLNASVLSSAAHVGVTSLARFGDSLLATGGRDGKVKVWDVRAGKSVVEMQTDAWTARFSENQRKDVGVYGRANRSVAKQAPVLSVACSPETKTIVAGTELVSSQAVVAFWDIRSPESFKLQYVESHNDDITELQYHPTRSNILLSGSTDGLANIYDTTVIDEDEALVQVINHGSIHHAGFLSDRAIFALSHDELFSVHPATDPDDATEEPEPVQFGDLRDPLGCEYIAQLCLGAQPYIAAGNKMEQRLDLVPLVSGPWSLDRENLWRLPGAHGEEVVRSVYLDEQSSSVFTCGEDGYVRVWKPEGEVTQSESKSKARPKEKKKDRYRPY